ncbi:peptidase families S8 and S53 domain protein [Synechococcus sp. PCC 7335]|uniref:S8 family peptidase n=1 Tax=Synechococcus sp. (strain ATCC 29403 / PCC 7335) TaxID=91464 RepID=UPI00017EE11A|nr:S8 family peptidase [Synechococcus sp. PCC 7335]EDX82883.1 peptidase families S8 and S53 domain protein [Synechococcus sp. PCC 7335]
MSQFEHLELPKTSIELPRRSRGGGGGGTSRSDRSSHGQQLLTQISGLTQRSKQNTSQFHLNPKLIFKIKLSPDGSLQESALSPLGLTLLAQEPRVNKAIVVFATDEDLTQFQFRLEVYSGLVESPYEYGHLDAITELVALEPADRTGRLLELEPIEPGETAALDLELWHTGDNTEMRQYIDELDDVLRGLSDNSEMRVSDRYVGSYLCIARIKVTSDVLNLLLEEDFVKEIDRRPKPNFETPAEYNISLSDLPEVNSPSEQNCGVLVVDSGVTRGHPLIAPALGEAEVFPDTAREFIVGGPDDGDELTGGHGTGVSGIAIYGDIGKGIEENAFQPDVWLFSARVTNQNNEYDPDSLLENQLDDAVRYFTQNYANCKIINISLGDARLSFKDGQKQFRLAAKIDELAYELRHKNLVFVISAGNLPYEMGTGEQMRIDYPNYLFEESAKIIEPATAAIALSVGSISLGTGSLQYSNDAQRTAIARVQGYPSPFTRRGFGVDGMIKPDLIDFGGDLVIDRTRIIPNEPGASIMTFARDFTGSMFRAYCGTSFAAPRVANIAAQLFTLFPNATSNLIRALIASSAELPGELPSVLQEQKRNDTKQLAKQLQVFGYGHPDVTRAKYSAENYAVLLEDDRQIPVGSFQIFEIPPLPEQYLSTPGTRILSVALAFDPPTRPTRGDSYLGITMEFNLFKDVSKDSIVQAFVNASRTDSPEDFTEISLSTLKKNNPGKGIAVGLYPGSNLRKKGCLQKGQINISDRAKGFGEQPLYLVLSCSRKWAKPEEIESQRYALVVSVYHSDPEVDVYNQLKLKTQVSPIIPRARIR